MGLTFSAISQERSAELITFLSSAFGMKDTPPNLSPEVLVWKYFAPHPWWPTGRGYFLETDNGIAAHGCMAPVRFAEGSAVLESMVVIDWASGKLVPGAGVLLCRRAMETLHSSMLAIGGSPDALSIFPQVRWFVPRAEMKWYAKSLRPWQRFLKSGRRLRDGLKFVRNTHRGFFPPLPAPGKWTCRRARRGDPVFTSAGDFIPILRTREWIDYLSGCPAARCALWILEHEGVPCGHALIANLGGSARVADFALGAKPTRDAVKAAFSALVRAVAADSDAIELVAASSLAEDIEAFEACGLQYRRCFPVLLADFTKAFPPNSALEIKPILGDAFYLYNPANPFQL